MKRYTIKGWIAKSCGMLFCGYAASFIRVADGRIASIDEYWGDDGEAPKWRQYKHIGTAIQGGYRVDFSI